MISKLSLEFAKETRQLSISGAGSNLITLGRPNMPLRAAGRVL